MAKSPKRSGKVPPKDEKPKWDSFTKAELIRTVKTLSGRQTKLLNQIAKLEREREGALAAVAQDAVNSAMDVRQPLAQLCDDYSVADELAREQHGVVTGRLPEPVDDTDKARKELDAANKFAVSFGAFPWETK